MNRWWEILIKQQRLRWFLVILDILLTNVAFFTAWWLRYEVEFGGPILFYTEYNHYQPTALVLSLLMVINLNIERLYRSRRGATWFDELYGIINATTTSMLLVVVFFVGVQYSVSSRLVYAYAAIALVVYLSIARLILRWWMGWLRQQGIGVTRILIVGGGESGRALMRHIVAQPQLGYQIVGFVDDNPTQQHNIGRFQALGDTEKIPELVSSHDVDKVIMTLPWQHQRKILKIMQQCEEQAVESRIVPDFFQLSLTRVTFDEIKGVPLIGLTEPALKGPNFALKRFVDVIVSTILLLFLTPVMMLVALAIRLESRGAVIFKQTRVGHKGRLFKVYKFRSMYEGADKDIAQLAKENEADGPIFKIRGDPRITRVGHIIRKTSLDELPQLWNVLRGNMSLVGPRPALPREVAQYEDWHRKRLEAPPGLTGLWQVSGRSDVTFDEMMLLDIYYTERWSLMLDIMILLKTIPAVLLQRGAY